MAQQASAIHRYITASFFKIKSLNMNQSIATKNRECAKFRLHRLHQSGTISGGSQHNAQHMHSVSTAHGESSGGANQHRFVHRQHRYARRRFHGASQR